MAKLAFLVAGCLATAQAALHSEHYDPALPDEPFDTASQALSTWLKEEVVVPRKKDGWQDAFCLCVNNGNIASWFQYASAMYIVDQCGPTEGFVLRSGHIQDRHVQPLQGMMACDTLKLMSYCLSHEAPEALPMWEPMCKEAHYTVPACDVACGSALRMARSSFGAIAALLTAVGLVNLA
mmetsp:Transcript_104516/g.185946  ORF Transcript_104516/g.185946 Transcript_104516/m.185946 type:complete len:180 (-) Transcript_104516:158-697(-)